MKRKDKCCNSNYQCKITIDEWFDYKDYFFIVWKGHSKLKESFGLNTQPKQRRRRSIKTRDCGRLYSLDSASIKRWDDIRIKKRRLYFDFKKM